MNNVMIDLETLDTVDTSVITSLGVVQFDINTGETGREFYMTIEAQSQIKMGRTVSIDTIRWWNQQDSKAFNEMFTATMPLEKVLQEFQFWFRSLKHPTLFERATPPGFNPKENVKVWGNSVRFDIGKLHNAFSMLSMEIPWNDRSNERCYKTYAKDFPNVKVMDDPSLKGHFPIDDCKWQIKKLCAIWQHITNNVKEAYAHSSTYAEALRLLYKIKDNQSPAIATLREEVTFFLNNPEHARPLASSDYKWSPHGPEKIPEYVKESGIKIE